MKIKNQSNLKIKLNLFVSIYWIKVSVDPNCSPISSIASLGIIVCGETVNSIVMLDSS